MKTKNILIASGVIIAGLALFGANKVKNMTAVFDRMTIRPVKLFDIKIKLFQLDFKLDLALNNPTNEAFTVSSFDVLNIKRIIVYRKDKLLGSALVNLSSIEVPARSITYLRDVQFTVDNVNLLENLLTVESFNVNDLSIHCIVELFGMEYSIES